MSFVDSLRTHANALRSVSPAHDPREYSRIFEELLRVILTFTNSGKLELKDGRYGSLRYYPKGRSDERRSPLMAVLADVVAVSLPVHFETDIPTLEEARTHVFMRPYRVEDLPEGKVRDLFIRRVQEESESGDFISLDNQVIILRLTMGMVDHKFLGYLKYYIEMSGGRLADFTSRGAIPYYDTSFMTRFLLLYNATLFEFAFRDIVSAVPFTIWDEVVRFLFQDPLTNSKELKGWIANHRKCAFCLTSGGVRLFYGQFAENAEKVIHSQDLDHPVGMTLDGAPLDREYYELQHRYLVENLANLQKAGLNNLASLLVQMISAEVKEENLRVLSVLFALEGLVGFTRGYKPEAIGRQVGVEAPTGNLPYVTQLSKFYRDYVNWSVQHDRFLSYSEFTALIHSIQTGKSAGSAKVVFDVPLSKEGASGIRSQGGKDSITFTMRSKRADFLANGAALLLKEKVTAGYFAGGETDEFRRQVLAGGMISPEVAAQVDLTMAGRVSYREVVGGKFPRGIFMRRTEHFIHEYVFARAMAEYQSENYEEFSFGQLTGLIARDHATLIKASSISNVVIDDSDFTAFDSYQTRRNMRGPALRAALEAMSEQPSCTTAWGPFEKGLYELLSIMWGDKIAYNAVYFYRWGDDLRVWVLDQLQSGELMTLLINDGTNKANDDYTEDVLRSEELVKQAVRKINVKFMGDDAETLYRVNDSYNTKVAERLLEVKRKAAADNELDLNIAKTGLRRYMGEYLKIRYAYGYYIPLLLTQLTGAERQTANVFPTELLRGDIAKAAVVAGRGMPNKFVELYMHHKWNLRRGIRVFLPHDVKMYYYLPFISLFFPGGVGGGGQHLCTMFGASKDTLIGYDMMTRVDWSYVKEMCEQWTPILALRNKSSIRQDIARKVARNQTKPVDVFRAGKEFIESTMLPSRKSAAAALASKFPQYRELDYRNMATNMIFEDIQSDSNTVALGETERLKQAKWMMTAEDKGVNPVPYSAVEYLTKSLRIDVIDEVVPRLSDFNPVPIYDGMMREACMTFGHIGSIGSRLLSASRLTSDLKRDKYWRRDVSDETIVGVLTKADFILNPRKGVEWLVFLGASAEAATKTVTKISQLAERYAISESGVNFSTRGSDLTNGFDMSHSRLAVIVKNELLRADTTLSSIINSIAFMHSFLWGMADGKFTKRQIVPASNAIGEMRTILLKGIRNVQSEKMIRLFPEAYFENSLQD